MHIVMLVFIVLKGLEEDNEIALHIRKSSMKNITK